MGYLYQTYNLRCMKVYTYFVLIISLILVLLESGEERLSLWWSKIKLKHLIAFPCNHFCHVLMRSSGERADSVLFFNDFYSILSKLACFVKWFVCCLVKLKKILHDNNTLTQCSSPFHVNLICVNVVSIWSVTMFILSKHLKKKGDVHFQRSAFLKKAVSFIKHVTVPVTLILTIMSLWFITLLWTSSTAGVTSEYLC